MDSVIWENPPTSSRMPASMVCPEAEALKSRPNEWARVFEFDRIGSAGTTSHAIKKGERRGFGPAGTFEAVSRTINNKGVVYARFVGEV